LKENEISIVGGISKFLKLIVFWQILTQFGSFGQIQLLWQWLTACPHLKGKKRKHHSFCKRYQNLACDGLLESPLNFPSTKKIHKIQLQMGIVVLCPKSQNSKYGTHSPLGVNP
jgi:hypothetical protein